MAETKGTDTKAGDVKTGPVKPPVLDLTAREAGTTAPKPDEKAEDKVESKAATPPDPKPARMPETKADGKPAPDGKPLPRPATVTTPHAASADPGFALGAAALGGALGLAAAYGLAWFGLWPTAPAVTPAADPRVAQVATAIPELQTVTQTTQSELARLNQRVATLEAAEPATPATEAAPPDLTGIEADIAALGERLDTLAAQPVADGAAATADLVSLTSRLDELNARVGTAEAGLRSLDTTVTETAATLAAQPGDIGAILQLPLILSGFETAFATGRPFEAELAALRAAAPDAAIPTAIANSAATGLARPDVIGQRFADVLPAMLAGRPANPDAQWQDGALDWFRSAIALRPTGELEGDAPEAVMSRLEGAVARRDFAAADTLLDQLPPSMRGPAGDLPAAIAAQAEAARFLDTLRIEALNGEATP